METHSDKSAYAALLITGLAIVLFSTAGIARMMGWGMNLTEESGELVAPDQISPDPPAGKTRTRPRCPECGVVVSVREVEGAIEDTGPGAAGAGKAGSRGGIQVKVSRHYEMVVRMADGAIRVIDHASPARWRTGERLIVIAGTDGPPR